MTNVTLYVYYKIPTEKHIYYLSIVKQMDAVLQALHPALKTLHQKRPELDRENRELWMDVYQDIPSTKYEDFSAELKALAEKHGLPPERKYELFVAL